MTREEALKQLSDAKEKINEANKALISFKAKDKQTAEAKLDLLNEEFSRIWAEAKELANQFCLEFTFEDNEGDNYLEFDSSQYGNWAHSSC